MTYEEIVAKIPELRGMAPGQVFNNQALIKTFDEALETTISSLSIFSI